MGFLAPVAGGLAKTAPAIGGALSSGVGGQSQQTGILNSQIAQAQLANQARQGIADEFFAQDPLLGFNAEDVFGQKPIYYPVEFDPLLEQDPGLRGLQRETTQSNLRNFSRNERLSERINSFLNRDAQTRVRTFDPLFESNMRQQGRNTALAAQGILPGSDVEQIAANRNRTAALFGGGPGTSRGQVARDLGLTRFQLQSEVAPRLQASTANIINALLPPQLRSDPRESQVDVSQLAGIAQADNQFDATFERQERNLQSLMEAAPVPAEQGLFSLENTLAQQQFAVDFGLADGFGVPAPIPGGNGFQNAGSIFGLLGQLGQSSGDGQAAQTGQVQTDEGLGGILGGFRTPGIFRR